MQDAIQGIRRSVEEEASGELTCDFLRTAEAAFAASTERFERYLAGMSDASANWSPLPGTWSVAGNIEHLVKGSELYFERMVPALVKGREADWTGKAPYDRGTLVGRMILGVLDPDRPRFRPVKTVPRFAPRPGPIDYAEICDRFRAVQRRWPEVLRLADGLDLGRIKIATPISPLLRVTVAQAIQIHVWHEPRHLEQAERITAHPDFPV